MRAWAEVVAHGAERTKEALRVLGGLEALQHPLSPAGRQVRVFGRLFTACAAGARCVWQHPSYSRHVTGESLLDQDVPHDTVPVDGTPQPMSFAVDLQQQLAEMPLVAWSGVAPA